MLHEDVKGEREFSQQWKVGSGEQLRTDSPGAPRWNEGWGVSRGRTRESGITSEVTTAWRAILTASLEVGATLPQGDLSTPPPRFSMLYLCPSLRRGWGFPGGGTF